MVFPEDPGPCILGLSKTHGWGEVVLLKVKKKKSWGLLVGRFYITLNLEVGREYIITWLFSPVG
jgi:hypothetical protein